MLALSVLPAILAVGISALAAQAGAGGGARGRLADQPREVPEPRRRWSCCSARRRPRSCSGATSATASLPLYFSRVLTRVDYALARVGGLFLALFVISTVPQLVLSVGAILAAPTR